MKHITSLSLILLGVTLLPSFSTQAEEPINFKPPQLGAPETRIGGGTRAISGINKPKNKIQLLATKQIGLTSSATPTVYWYAPKTSSDSVKLTVRSGEDEPLLETNIGAVKTTGVQTVQLADYGVSLAPDKDYIWSITVVGNPEQGAADQFSSAIIRYTVPATPLTDTAQMAEAGYWYDTVAQLVETKSPQLDKLLQQEGISIKTGK